MSPEPLPRVIAEVTAGATWEPETIGRSGAAVWRARLPGGATRYLKLVGVELRGELTRECAALRWLAGRLPVPAVLAMADDATGSYLLTDAAPGVMACAPAALRDPAGVARTLGVVLRRIHALPTVDCPLPRTLAMVLDLAAARVAAGLVDATDFDADHAAMTPAELLARLRRARPATEDLVLTHGDFCLPNVLLDPTTLALTGLVDWGRAGVADRYQDLAIGARSVAYNLGATWVAAFLAAYGLGQPDASQPDAAKLEYYRLLDEMF